MKTSAISPDIFRGFAKELIAAHRKDEFGEIDESDPLSIYRDSDREKALNRPTEQAPRRDFARASWSNSGMDSGDKLKTSGRNALALYAAAKRHQAKHQQREEIIPGSGYISHGGVAYRSDAE